MKKLFILGISTLLLASCAAPQQIIYREAEGRNIEPALNAVVKPLIADLQLISEQSISELHTFDVNVTTDILKDIDKYKNIALLRTIKEHNVDTLVGTIVNVDTNKDGKVDINIDVNKDEILAYLEKKLIKNTSSFVCNYVKSAIADSYKRLIGPSIEREVRSDLTEKGEEAAIDNFGKYIGLISYNGDEMHIKLDMSIRFRKTKDLCGTT